MLGRYVRVYTMYTEPDSSSTRFIGKKVSDTCQVSVNAGSLS